ncbi:MAG: hypothetical protein ACOC3W_09980 [Thermodesulfobacteriota bacterium]
MAVILEFKRFSGAGQVFEIALLLRYLDSLFNDSFKTGDHVRFYS